MRKTSVLLVALGLAAATAYAQVVSPPEILDKQLRELQQKHFSDLKKVAVEISGHTFPYQLYFSRTLDLNEKQQKHSDQRSIRFDKFEDQTVLEITANYYAAYSADQMEEGQRANRTLQDVGVPMLEAAIPALQSEDKLQSYALEISHHVRKKVLGVMTENPENVAFVLPAKAANQFMAATTPGEREAALIQGQLYVNRQPIEGWGDVNTPVAREKKPQPTIARVNTSLPMGKGLLNDNGPYAPIPTPGSRGLAAEAPVPQAARPEATPATLQALQTSHQPELDRLVQELDKQAHFTSYAPPAFIVFRKGAYLQLSMKTVLKESAGSQYQMAGLAFDEHIAHLIRPVLAALKGQTDFDGIDFSTTVRLAGAPDGEGTAIEFIFPASGLTGYQDYDLTGQQLINMGYVLINGERVGLDLQSAQSTALPQR
jgi:hypothetical protein